MRNMDAWNEVNSLQMVCIACTIHNNNIKPVQASASAMEIIDVAVKMIKRALLHDINLLISVHLREQCSFFNKN